MGNEKELKVGKVILVVLLTILINVAIAGSIYDIVTGDMIYQILAILNVAALACGIHYTVDGFKKNAAFYFRMYMLICAFVVLVTICGTIATVSVNGIVYAILFGLMIINFGSFLILAVGKDIGKVASLILAIYNLLLWGYMLIERIIKNSWNDAAIIVGLFTLSSMALFMTVAKYIDKKERHTK